MGERGECAAPLSAGCSAVAPRWGRGLRLWQHHVGLLLSAGALRLLYSVGNPHTHPNMHPGLHPAPPHTPPPAGESPNDRNDRAIRRAAEWYTQRLSSRLPVIFLTNDRASRALAQAQGLTASGTAAYARTRVDAPDLLDIAARYEEAEGEPMEQVGSWWGWLCWLCWGRWWLLVVAAGGGWCRVVPEGGAGGRGCAGVAGAGGGCWWCAGLVQLCCRQAAPEPPVCMLLQDGPSGSGSGAKKRRRIYTEHLPMSEVQGGIRAGRLHQGVLRVNR